ncbi:hypothetical protein EV715DRAFT_214421 [Schizophyllum commune]
MLEPIIDGFMAKHGHTDALPAGSLYVTDDLESLPLRVVQEDNATTTSYRLFMDDDDGEDEKELTLYSMGVLSQKLLPPFKPKSRKYTPGRQGIFAGFRQSVTLHGAGTAPGEKTVQAVKYGFVLLDRCAAKGATFPADRARPDNLVFWNPYFTVGEEAKEKESIPFPKSVDPFDDLNRAVTDGCVHTADNDVQYFAGSEDDQGCHMWTLLLVTDLTRLLAVTPSRFRPGDVVRVGFSICLKQDNKSHGASELNLVLRSVTLINDTLSTALAIKMLDDLPSGSRKRPAAARGLLVEDKEERPVLKVRKALSKFVIHGTAMDVEEHDNSVGEGSAA